MKATKKWHFIDTTINTLTKNKNSNVGEDIPTHFLCRSLICIKSSELHTKEQCALLPVNYLSVRKCNRILSQKEKSGT